MAGLFKGRDAGRLYSVSHAFSVTDLGGEKSESKVYCGLYNSPTKLLHNFASSRGALV